jgi:hypothetical protein
MYLKITLSNQFGEALWDPKSIEHQKVRQAWEPLFFLEENLAESLFAVKSIASGSLRWELPGKREPSVGFP